MKSGKQRQKPKVVSPAPERRFLPNGELRIATGSDGKPEIVGYATKFIPAMSLDLGGWFEQIAPHCFDACLANNPDVRALWNHDPNHVLGRSTANTLRLSVNNTGLLYEIDPPDTTMARDLLVSLSRGDVTQSSFGFVADDDSWGRIVRAESSERCAVHRSRTFRP